jgi:hypothetical protein
MRRFLSSSVATSAVTAPPSFASLLDGLTALAKQRKSCTTTRPHLLHSALAVASSPEDVSKALHASFLRGNLVPTPATASLVARALVARPGAGGAAAATKAAVAALCNPRLRLPASGAAFGALLRAAPREGGSTLPREIVQAALSRGVEGSGEFTVTAVASLAGAGDFAGAAALLRKRAASSRPAARRAAFALFFKLQSVAPEAWGLSPALLQFLAQDAVPWLTSPAGKKLALAVAPLLEAASKLPAAAAAAQSPAEPPAAAAAAATATATSEAAQVEK